MRTGTLPAGSLGVIAYGAGDLRIEDVPLRTPAPDEAVVEIAYGGVCGSDLHYWTHGAAGESILRAPLVLGHEVAGTVVQAAADGSGLAVGTPVAVHPATPGDDGATRFPPDRPNLHRGAPTSGARRASRTATGRSSGTPCCPVGCSARCPTGWTCVLRR